MPTALKTKATKANPKPARRVVRPSPARPGNGPKIVVPPKLPSIVNVHEAKTQLSRLLARVEAGEEITIARAGHPFARLVPLAAAPLAPRVPGRFKGLFGPLSSEDALAPLPPEYSGLISSPSDPLNLP
jgi:prevent-host-death family protein